MARTLDQVIAEVSAQSDPQRKLVLDQISNLPGQQQAEESSLAAQKDQAYTDILNGARRRGLGFAGIPLGEQAQYNATQYAPAVAKLKTSYNDRKSSLESALADIGRNDYNTAYNIYNQDRAFEEQQRQFNEQMAMQKRAAAAAAAQAASASSYLSGLGGNTQTAQTPSKSSSGNFYNPSKPTYTNNNGSFAFFDAGGSPITAAQYAKQAGVPLTQIINNMAAAGDKTAKLIAARQSNAVGTGLNAYSLTPAQTMQWKYILGGV